MQSTKLELREIEIDPVTDVPLCYVEFFQTNSQKNKKDVPKQPIKIEVIKKGKNDFTVVHNISSFFTNKETRNNFAIKISNGLATKATFNDDDFMIRGKFEEKIVQILKNEYNIPNESILSSDIEKKSNQITVEAIGIGKSVKVTIHNLLLYVQNVGNVKTKTHFHLKIPKNEIKVSEKDVIFNYTKKPKDVQQLLEEKFRIPKEEIQYVGTFFQEIEEIPDEPKYLFKEFSYDKRSKCKSLKDYQPLRNLGKYQKYYDEVLGIIYAEWNDAIENKKRLQLKLQLEFDKGNAYTKNDQLYINWQTKFPTSVGFLPNSDIDVNSFSATNYLFLNDVVKITWDNAERKFNMMKGKIINIEKNIVTVSLKLSTKNSPPDYEKKDRITYTIDFEPNSVIYRRRIIALSQLVLNTQSRLRDFIIYKNPNENDVYEDIDASFDFSDYKDLTGIDNPSRLKFDPTYTQEEAIKKALSNTITLIQGPPGCGKTATIASIVVNFLRKQTQNKKRILVCSQTNVSLMNLLDFLIPPVKALNKKIVWVSSDKYKINNRLSFERANNILKQTLFYQCLTRNSKKGKKLQELILNAWDYHLPFNQIINNLSDEIGINIAYESDVVVTTLESSMNSSIKDLLFDTVIIDEATQAIEMSAIIPFVHYPNKIILVGDQKQLEPVLSPSLQHRKRYVSSLFTRLIHRNMDYTMLDVQFRMHPLISKFPNQEFYYGQIHNGITAQDRRSNITNIKMPITFYNIQGEESRNSKTLSYKNETEANLIQSIVNRMIKKDKVQPTEIGIIAFYSLQVQCLQKKFEVYYYKNQIKISTVDSFQGSERDYIIISCVRSNSDGEIGFLSDMRRLNVAITRAKRGLIIVGDRFTLSLNDKWNSLFKYIEQKVGESFSKDLSLMISIQQRDDSNKLIITFKKPKEDFEMFIEKMPSEDPNVGFNLKEVKSSITNANNRILWPDDEEDVQYFKDYVNTLLNKLNEGKHITISYDTESVCIQFGEVFDEDYDLFGKNLKPIPSIGNKEGVIAFYYTKQTNEFDSTYFNLSKQLFEHPNITILTFDFTNDIELLIENGINPNMKRIIDGQVSTIYEQTNEINLISYTNVFGLKRIFKTMKYKGEYVENAIEEICNGEKNFPWAYNHFVQKVTNIPPTSEVTKQFLQYSANDIPLTALTIADIIEKDLLNDTIKLTKQKVNDFINARNEYGKAYNLRQSYFLKNDYTIITQSSFDSNETVENLIELWDKISKVMSMIQLDNEKVDELLRISKKEKENISERMKTLEEIMVEVENWRVICKGAKLALPMNVKPLDPLGKEFGF
ncbi:regulator of nonsense transcripts 1 (UPF1, RENT1) [Histomonas meleagridis]|uniref:regulator of nonsense transcripts 1 n=1 Tax=Histomonas meleagridis TaxID=135588 RepID=UPI00355A3EEA|nr:regulator of nonsense transcripts 1 (UPF1, RENT1) [Histomonas meleagridis]KAH0802211.1 regulator of nonsense transcripts 1 [Histomonas meleagridis]